MNVTSKSEPSTPFTLMDCFVSFAHCFCFPRFPIQYFIWTFPLSFHWRQPFLITSIIDLFFFCFFFKINNRVNNFILIIKFGYPSLVIWISNNLFSVNTECNVCQDHVRQFIQVIRSIIKKHCQSIQSTVPCLLHMLEEVLYIGIRYTPLW